MRIEHTTIPNLSEQTREYIYKYMSYSKGAMRYWIDFEDEEVCLAILYRELPIAWAGFVGDEVAGYSLGAWTDEDFRKKGFGTRIIKALLSHHNISKNVIIEIYDEQIEKILDKLGYANCNTWWSVMKT